ncbi:MAG TPA: carboxypeptidase-like regulatory domain-containing protein [Candidatus Nitrosotenuis sp.]
MRQIAFIGIVFFIAFCTCATHASAAPFDFLVNAKLEQHQIELGQKPVVFGTVTDNVLRPVSGIEVKITFGANSATTVTDSNGEFRQEFSEQMEPGIFTVNVFAKQDGKKGFGDATLRISKQMTTFSDMYYNSKLSDLTDQKKSDPYESLKIKNYERFLKEKNKMLQKQIDIEAKKVSLQEKKDIASQRLNQTITELKPGPGSLSGDKYDRYFSELNPSIRDDVANQMNYTRKIITDAKLAMKQVLDSGGTPDEARKAYLEKLSTKRDSMEKIADLNGTENHSKPKKHDEKSSSKVKGLTAKKLYK